MVSRMSVRRVLVAVLVGTMLSTVLATAPVGAQQPDDSGQDTAPVALERSRRGEAAIRALGDRLPEVAAAHKMTAAELRKEFRKDDSLWVDAGRRLFYIEPAEEGDPQEAAAEAAALAESTATIDLGQTFDLHSDPASTRTIYLDFDGASITGAAWNSLTGESVLDATPFSLDDDPGFTDGELRFIQDVWRRVGEDFAPFDVDVTTAPPTAAELERSNSGDTSYGTVVQIAGRDTKAYAQLCGICGGYAYINVFGVLAAQPAWVFQKGLGGDHTSAKLIAEAASHEAGHNLALTHDGTSSLGYYRGHGLWAPIMGIGYDEPLVQWSKGEYPGANNGEDDVDMVAAYLPARSDANHTNATATNLGTVSSVAAAEGVISTQEDVDVFRFELTSPSPVVIGASPTGNSPNVDISVKLQDAGGAQIGAEARPVSAQLSTDVASGLDATISTSLAQGVYYAHVAGVGEGDLTTGYSDYGSLGDYTIEVQRGLCAVPDETVQDDSLAQAQPLVGGSTTNGRHCDEDWYRVPAIAGTTFSATLTGADGVDLDLQLLDANGDEVDRSDAGGATETVETTFAAGDHSDYYLRVFGAPGVEGDYDLATTMPVCLPDDRWEQDDGINQTVSNVSTIPGEKVAAVCGAEWDNANVSLTAGVPVTVELNYPASMNPTLALFHYPANGFGSVASGSGSGGRKLLHYLPTSSTTHQIGILGGTGAAIPYRVAIRPFDGPPPTISSMSPVKGAPGQVVQIFGSGFSTLTSVTFAGGVPAASFTVNSSSYLTAVVPAGASTGHITIDNGSGPTQLPRSFSVLPSATPPANDAFASPTPLAGVTGTISQSTVGATTESGEYTYQSGGASVWFQWTPSTDGTLTMDTFGSDYDAQLYLTTATQVNVVPLFVGNDDSGAAGDDALQGRVLVDSPAMYVGAPTKVEGGTTYRVAVLGYQGETGNLVLNWDFDSVPSMPVVTGISPMAGPVGTQVTITGTDLTAATNVAFDGTSAIYDVVNDTTITTYVPYGATDGPVTVTTGAGTSAPFGTFDVQPPVLSELWGTDGVVTTDFPVEEGFVDVVAPLSAGAYVAYNEGYDSAVIARHLDDGSLDTTFGGGDGMVGFDPLELSTVHDLAVDSQGRLVMIGQRTDGPPMFASYMRVVRLTWDGSLDPTFGGGDGTVELVDPIESADYGYAYDVRTDALDRIVIAATGHSPVTGSFDPKVIVQRFTEGGGADTTFGGGDGAFVTDLSDTPGENYTVGEVALTSAGDLRIFASRSKAPSGAEISVIGLQGEGTLDTSYGTDGLARWTCPGPNAGFVYGGGILDDDTAVFVAGCDAHGSHEGIRTGRFTPEGVFDSSYAGGAGTRRYLTGAGEPLMPSLEIPVSTDGTVYVHGFTDTEYLAGRVTPGGAIDGAYETALVHDTGRSTAGAVDLAGRFYVGGWVGGNAVVRRFPAAPLPDPNVPPEVSVLAPSSAVRGMTDVVAAVSDADDAVVAVSVYIDDTFVGSATEQDPGRWTYAWDPGALADDQPHTIDVVATDESGGTGGGSVTVPVMRTTPEPPVAGAQCWTDPLADVIDTDAGGLTTNDSVDLAAYCFSVVGGEGRFYARVPSPSDPSQWSIDTYVDFHIDGDQDGNMDTFVSYYGDGFSILADSNDPQDGRVCDGVGDVVDGWYVASGIDLTCLGLSSWDFQLRVITNSAFGDDGWQDPSGWTDVVGQAGASGVEGAVMDELGDPIARACVAVRASDGVVAIAATDPSGGFSFGDLDAGQYVLRVSDCHSSTYATVDRPMEVLLGHTHQEDFVLTNVGHGFVRATTSPAVPAQIRIDGENRERWGLSWVKVPAGFHEVSFGDIGGFSTPAPQDVTVSVGQTTVVEGGFTPRGFLRVITEPALPSTISVDGVPRNDWGMWTDFPVGNYSVCFGAVVGYAAPACQEVSVTAGANTTVTGSFLLDENAPAPEEHGLLRVATDPAVPSQILVDGEIADTWGLTWLKLSPGTHTVSFTDVEGYQTPASRTLEVVAGVTTEVVGQFERNGTLRVLTDPALPSTIFVDGVPRNDYGLWTDVAPGEYFVCFGEVAGLVGPDCASYSVLAGETTTVIGSFVAASPALAEGPSPAETSPVVGFGTMVIAPAPTHRRRRAGLQFRLTTG